MLRTVKCEPMEPGTMDNSEIINEDNTVVVKLEPIDSELLKHYTVNMADETYALMCKRKRSCVQRKAEQIENTLLNIHDADVTVKCEPVESEDTEYSVLKIAHRVYNSVAIQTENIMCEAETQTSIENLPQLEPKKHVSSNGMKCSVLGTATRMCTNCVKVILEPSDTDPGANAAIVCAENSGATTCVASDVLEARSIESVKMEKAVVSESRNIAQGDKDKLLFECDTVIAKLTCLSENGERISCIITKNEDHDGDENTSEKKCDEKMAGNIWNYVDMCRSLHSHTRITTENNVKTEPPDLGFQNDVNITDLDIDFAETTKKKTTADINLFELWLKCNLPHEKRKIEEIPPLQLNEILKSFFATVKKKGGKEYDPNTIKAIQNSLERYLSGKMYFSSILKGEEFKSSRMVLKAKRYQLKHDGQGLKPIRMQALVGEGEEVLWNKGIMGKDNPVSLQNAIWWRNNFLGLSNRQEHRDLCWGDILIHSDEDKCRYIEYHERDTNNRKFPIDTKPTRLYATPDKPERCPVDLLILFTEKRPTSMLQADSPFYLSPVSECKITPERWYKQCPLGIHSLGSMMKTMAARAGLTAKLMNHSGKKTLTTVKRIREAEDIIQATELKSEQSVNNDSDACLKKQKQMSN